MKRFFSKCCNSSFHSYDDVPPGDGSDCYHVCDKCEKACDLTQLVICPTCSFYFKPHNRLQKYCDTNCRNKANYKKHKRISRGELIAWLKVRAEYRASVDIDTILEFLGEDK